MWQSFFLNSLILLRGFHGECLTRNLSNYLNLDPLLRWQSLFSTVGFSNRSCKEYEPPLLHNEVLLSSWKPNLKSSHKKIIHATPWFKRIPDKFWLKSSNLKQRWKWLTIINSWWEWSYKELSQLVRQTFCISRVKTNAKFPKIRELRHPRYDQIYTFWKIILHVAWVSWNVTKIYQGMHDVHLKTRLPRSL